MKYFYNARTEKERLRRDLNTHLEKTGFSLSADSPEAFLKSLDRLGFCLTDAIRDPLLKGLSRSRRNRLALCYAGELIEEVCQTEPSIIVTLGGVATFLVAGFKEVVRHHGEANEANRLSLSRIRGALGCVKWVIVSIFLSESNERRWNIQDFELPFRELYRRYKLLVRSQENMD